LLETAMFPFMERRIMLLDYSSAEQVFNGGVHACLPQPSICPDCHCFLFGLIPLRPLDADAIPAPLNSYVFFDLVQLDLEHYGLPKHGEVFC
jgi:hypothetical protein